MSPFKKYNETGGICWVGGEPKIYNFYQIFDNKGMVKRKKNSYPVQQLNKRWLIIPTYWFIFGPFTITYHNW